MDDLQTYLQPGEFVDSDHPEVRAFAERTAGDRPDDRSRAVTLFYAVRDGWRYDPYGTSKERADYRASAILTTNRTWCVPKSVILTAAARALGVPSRLGFGDVRNHLQSTKLLETMGTDLFVWHGYSEFFLDGRWVKASSAFNKELCERFGTKVLDFDGAEDALMHPYDTAGNRHMEYVRTRGSYADLPYDEIMATFREVYPSSISGAAGGGPDEAFA